MVGWATYVAAKVINADNLPPRDKLPEISLIDAFLPRRSTPRSAPPRYEKKPLDPNVGMRVYREFYDVKKDKNGKKALVVHKDGSSQGSKKGEVMTQDVKKNDGGKGGGGGNAGGGGEKKDGGGGGGSGEWKSPEVPFTAEEDAQLIDLKAKPNTSWKDIAAEMKRSQKALKQRWGEINPNKGGQAGAGNKNECGKDKNNSAAAAAAGGGDNNNKGKDKKADKPTKIEKKPESKAPSKVGSARKEEARFTMNEWLTLQEDDIFSFGELQCLSELMVRDENQRWLRIASAFTDKTGRRVHPRDIRDKFEQIGAMG